MTSAPAIGFEYAPSRLLRRCLMVVAALAALAVALSGLAISLKLMLIAAVVLATWQSLQPAAQSPLAAAGWDAEGGWTLRTADHEDIAATLATFRVFGGFILLRLLTVERGMQILLLAPDNSDRDIRRRLRMRLATVQPGEALPRI
ncbi:protein YgfX [Rhodanobacter ginsenosidimutans]|uniref:Protein YgfX n=1 Tax=Rhodanobacter ginsenosidimutans TaxID=490571 RepID=A0ABW0JY92_9GAMM